MFTKTGLDLMRKLAAASVLLWLVPDPTPLPVLVIFTVHFRLGPIWSIA
jgi:hypothetical protein